MVYHNRKIKDKKRVGFRGPKKRQSVFRAELNRNWEIEYEKLVKQICIDNDLNINDFMSNDERIPWEHTWDNIESQGYRLRSRSIKDRLWNHSWFKKWLCRRFW
jgi:hypothetical protein